ncbi:MAG: acyl-CoA thioesterase II, partial [Sphingobium sp.]
ILEMIASFQRTSEGMEHCIAMPASPSPDSLADDDMRGASVGIELRNRKVPRPGMVATIEPPNHQMWFRSRVPLGDAIRLHQAALAYASDFPQLPTIVQPHPVTWRTPGFQFASLDHAIWFHRPLDFTHWHLCDLDTPSSSQQRGLCRSSVFTQDGTLVATVMQEAMIRMRRSPL